MFKRHTSNCHRCGAVLRANTEVCSTCCAPQTSAAPQAPVLAAREPVAVAAPAAAAPQTGLGAWPFGRADAEAVAQVAALATIDDVRGELSQYSAQSTTHVLGAIPVQRPAQPVEELQSVPSVGPNPFLAAARMQNARDEAAALEDFPA